MLYLQQSEQGEKNSMNNEMDLDGEISIYDAVKNLSEPEIKERVERTAKRTEFNVGPEQMDVILTLVNHYKELCETDDCHAASPHMRFLNEAYEAQGGSKYLYHLFDQGSTVGTGGSELGIITRIHELAELPELTNNEDDGVGSVL